ncbi:MAG TPA: G1 family glutamic endopeptidase [Stellaceae bacterium]|nr:G1 family glutamic endopeptidase [Stellaceae bacterium]
MKTHLCSRGCVIGFAVAGVVGLIAPQAAPPAPFGTSHARHAPIGVHRNDDGSLKLGPRNQAIETSNWSGYAAAYFSTSDYYTAATATWTVPKVTYVTPPEVCRTVTSFFGGTRQVCTQSHPSAEYSSSWVGIGGYCENSGCTSVDNTLIQLGTEQDVSSRGTTQYYAWIETLPESESELSPTTYPVKPGDTITASLLCTANCTSGQTQTWTLEMTSSEGWTYKNTTVSYASTLLSAEWIQEAPSSSAGVLPLADYGTASFNATADGLSPPPAGTLEQAGVSNGILMVNPYGETSNPSALVSSEFNTCWGNNPNSIASCAAP